MTNIFASLFPLASVAHAVTISAAIPGTSTSTTTTGAPGAMINNFYQFAIFISGLLAFAIIVYAGVKYMASAGNPSGQGDAKEWIWSALLGILLLAGAYLILNIINPSITTLSLPDLTPATVATATVAGGSSGGNLIWGCIASNGTVACSPGNKSNCSDVPNGACANKTCEQVTVAQCGASAGYSSSPTCTATANGGSSGSCPDTTASGKTVSQNCCNLYGAPICTALPCTNLKPLKCHEIGNTHQTAGACPNTTGNNPQPQACCYNSDTNVAACQPVSPGPNPCGGQLNPVNL